MDKEKRHRKQPPKPFSAAKSRYQRSLSSVSQFVALVVSSPECSERPSQHSHQPSPPADGLRKGVIRKEASSSVGKATRSGDAAGVCHRRRGRGRVLRRPASIRFSGRRVSDTIRNPGSHKRAEGVRGRCSRRYAIDRKLELAREARA
jgi:hypothetical protein